MDCLFCKIAKKEMPSEVLYEDDDIFCFLDIRPINKGHALIIPKQHHENLFDTPDDLLSKLIITAKKLGKVILNTVQADGLNLGMNNKPAAGQVIFHTHLHVMPRFEDDGHTHWKGKETTKTEREAVAEKIKEQLH
ncbi:HIT domain-containing protein [Candidatus Woesearchaeota archaeon]|nr:HIT domain-containing protein [Candidatus Woesearchaeota archaeon]